MKRKSTLDNVSTNKLRSKSSINSIEDLSKEFFYEIFDYLDAWDISDAFSNLNYRFEQLINNSSILYKIKLIDRSMSNDVLFKNWVKIGHLNRKQVFSIHLFMQINTNQLALSLFVDSSLHRLQSLVLIEPKSDILMLILGKLIYLPRFSSLTIEELRDLTDLTTVYRLILTLPVLTYFKMSTHFSESSISLSMITQSSSLEYLILNDPCTFNELSTILSNTPQLRHLTFQESKNNDKPIRMLIPLIPIHLTYLDIHVHHVTFNQFEIFICQWCSKLKVLMFTTSLEDITYMDACRWQRLIVEDLPQLKKFSLQYREEIDKDEPTIHFEQPNPFVSSFWLERQWRFEIEIECEYIVYAVRPYRKRWYKQPNVNLSTLKPTQSIQLSILSISLDEYYQLLIKDINQVLNVTPIHHLQICDKIGMDILVQLTNELPQVTTMKLHSLSLDKAKDSETDEFIVFSSTKSINRIKEVYLDKVSTMKEIYSLMKKYPQMSYLKINSFENIDVDVSILNILKRINRHSNQHLRSLCFRAPIPFNDDSMVHIVNKTKIDLIINWIDGYIFFQWK